MATKFKNDPVGSSTKVAALVPYGAYYAAYQADGAIGAPVFGQVEALGLGGDVGSTYSSEQRVLTSRNVMKESSVVLILFTTDRLTDPRLSARAA